MASRRRKFWLMKSEPDVFSIEDLERVGRTPWDGVRNYQARNYMRDEMRVGDRVLFYHSNANPTGVVGVAVVASAPYPDPSQFEPTGEHFDPKSDASKPRWFLVDVAFVERFPSAVSLSTLKGEPKLAEMLVVRRGMRLSIQPVVRQHFELVVRMGRGRTRA